MPEKIFKNDIGIVSYMAYPSITNDFSKVVEAISKIASDPFFNIIEITHINDEKTREVVKKILEMTNIRVIFGAHPIIFGEKLNLNSIDNPERRKAVERLKEFIDEAYLMNSESFVIVSGPKPDDKDREKNTFEALQVSIEELCEFSIVRAKENRRKTVDILLETFDDKIFAKNRYIGPTELAADLSKNIFTSYSNFGLLLDLSHIPIIGEDFRKSLSAGAEFVKHIHIGNCILKDKNHKAYGDEHPRICAKNSEIFIEELADFIDALFESGYLDNIENGISFEVKPMEGEDPDLTIAGSKRVLLRALKKSSLLFPGSI